jgi:hypothetical protein
MITRSAMLHTRVIARQRAAKVEARHILTLVWSGGDDGFVRSVRVVATREFTPSLDTFTRRVHLPVLTHRPAFSCAVLHAALA